MKPIVVRAVFCCGKFERNKKFVYLSCHLANSRQHTFPWILVQYIICWTNLDFYFKFESSPAEWHTEISPHRQAGSTIFFAAQLFFARMSRSEQSTFHGQAFDRALSFRSSPFNTSRGKKGKNILVLTGTRGATTTCSMFQLPLSST